VLAEVEGWATEFERLCERVGPRFARPEVRRRAAGFLRGLLGGVERKNGWQLAEHAREVTPDGMQRLLTSARWDADALRDDVRAYVVGQLGDPGGVLVVDETGFLKKGTRSAGVQRQYSGTAGRVENCQVGVFLAYASSKGRALVDRELYLPKEWAADPARRGDAHVPEQVGFHTKPQLAQQMLTRALDARVPAGWVTADEVYGGDARLRAFLEERDLAYVLAVKATQPLWAASKQGPAEVPARQLVARLPTSAWRRRSAGDGAKGPRVYDWARVALTRPGWPRRGFWLLVRRRLGDGELAFYVCFGPARTSLAGLVRVAGIRWAVEECFQAAKDQVGLDHYQVRRYDAWYRHVTLVLVAQGFLAAVRTLADPTARVGAGGGWARRTATTSKVAKVGPGRDLDRGGAPVAGRAGVVDTAHGPPGAVVVVVASPPPGPRQVLPLAPPPAAPG
jgi:SRSO17 transposase